jgi:hypothetical protein
MLKEESMFRYYLCEECTYQSRTDKDEIVCLLPNTKWCGIQDWKQKAKKARKYGAEYVLRNIK